MSVIWERAGHGWNPTSDHIIGGYDLDNVPLYVGRVRCKRGLIPGKVNVAHGPVCYVSHKNGEKKYSKFEVVRIRPGFQCAWKSRSDGQIPPDAIDGGYKNSGEPLYIGRFMYKDKSLVIGRVQPSHKSARAGFRGREHKSKNYEILCTVPCINVNYPQLNFS